MSFAPRLAEDSTTNVPAPAANEVPVQVKVNIVNAKAGESPGIIVKKDSEVSRVILDMLKNYPSVNVTEGEVQEADIDFGYVGPQTQQADMLIKIQPNAQQQNQPVMNAVAKVVQKISITAAPASVQGIKVFIDPGHGGITADGESGAVFNGIQEKDLTLQVSQKVLQKLQAKGIQAAISRTGNEAITISDRVARANAFFGSNPAASNYLVSIHFDQPKATCLGESVTHALYNCIDTPACNSVVQESKSFANSMVSAINGRGIAAIVQTMSEGQSGIGETGGQLGIFNGLNTKNAVLLELEYLCNQENAQKVQTPEWQEKTASAIAEGILNFSQSNPAIDSQGFKTVYATVHNFSGGCTYCVALPLEGLDGRTVKVCDSKTENCAYAGVKDVGPWCTNDPNYVNGTAAPFAQTYKDKLWTDLSPAQQSYCGIPRDWPSNPTLKSNGAGIDLSPDLAARLGVSGNGLVKWKFA